MTGRKDTAPEIKAWHPREHPCRAKKATTCVVPCGHHVQAGETLPRVNHSGPTPHTTQMYILECFPMGPIDVNLDQFYSLLLEGVPFKAG